MVLGLVRKSSRPQLLKSYLVSILDFSNPHRFVSQKLKMRIFFILFFLCKNVIKQKKPSILLFCETK